MTSTHMCGNVIFMETTQILTSKQKQILKFIYECIKLNHLPPTLREIAEKFDFSSTGTVRDHLKALVQKGYIKISEGKSRAIELIENTLLQVPVLGRVQAGQPIYAIENLIGYLNMDEIIFPDKNIYALKVSGDSMVEAGIFPDDFILVRLQEMAKVGEIVIARINDEEITVKRLAKRDGCYFLDPANPKYEPIPVNDKVAIAGVVINVVRKYK